jgi:uncharacterized protein (TIGR02145 family)
MKKRNIFWLYPIVLIGVLFITNGCKKEDTTTKKDPVITWSNPADITYGTLLSATQLNATADVSGTFEYTPAIGTQLNAGANQDLKVDFTPTDGATYNTVSKTVKINVIAKQDPEITWSNPADITYGTLLSATQLNATANVPGTFEYTPAIGTQLSVGANQDLTVDFTPTDLATYNTASKTVKINVKSETVTDIDGNVYNTVIIGTQIWMVENLNVTHYNDGTEIPNITDADEWGGLSTGAYCNYDNIESNATIYGHLYNWYAVNTGKLAPTGWHVPTDEEWTTFENYLIVNGYNYDGSTTDNKIAKSIAATSGWYSSVLEGVPGNSDYSSYRNKSGFTALPGGYRYSNGSFYSNSVSAYWWSSTEDSNTSDVWERDMSYDQSNLYRYGSTEEYGYSVRCVKD